MARPKSDNPKFIPFTIRLDEEMDADLKEVTADDPELSASQHARIALRKYLKEKLAEIHAKKKKR